MEDFQYQNTNKQKELGFGKLVKMVRKGVYNGITTSYRITPKTRSSQLSKRYTYSLYIEKKPNPRILKKRIR